MTHRRTGTKKETLSHHKVAESNRSNLSESADHTNSFVLTYMDKIWQ